MEECASAPWLMVCSLREMVTSLASVSIHALFISLLVNTSLSHFSLIMSSYLQQVDLADANSIMEVVGMKLEMDTLTLRVWLVVINSINFFLSPSACKFMQILTHSSFQQPTEEGKCTCPSGFKGDGKSCEGKMVLHFQGHESRFCVWKSFVLMKF